MDQMQALKYHLKQNTRDYLTLILNLYKNNRFFILLELILKIISY
jgi:hypothetical protein